MGNIALEVCATKLPVPFSLIEYEDYSVCKQATSLTRYSILYAACATPASNLNGRAGTEAQQLAVIQMTGTFTVFASCWQLQSCVPAGAWRSWGRGTMCSMSWKMSSMTGPKRLTPLLVPLKAASARTACCLMAAIIGRGLPI